MVYVVVPQPSDSRIPVCIEPGVSRSSLLISRVLTTASVPVADCCRNQCYLPKFHCRETKLLASLLQFEYVNFDFNQKAILALWPIFFLQLSFSHSCIYSCLQLVMFALFLRPSGNYINTRSGNLCSSIRCRPIPSHLLYFYLTPSYILYSHLYQITELWIFAFLKNSCYYPRIKYINLLFDSISKLRQINPVATHH